MKRKEIFLSVVCCLLASAVFAERQPYDRYQCIVDRQMFGPLPPGFDPTKPPSEAQKSSLSDKQLTQEQAKLKSAIHFSVINVTPDGATAVGFTDKSDPKAPVHYYLKVGEKRTGWEVKAADPLEASMTIAKGDIEVSLKIGGDSTKDANATTKAGGAGASASDRSEMLKSGSLRSRRQRRAEEQAKKEAAAAEREAAAAEREAERQAQAEADKAQREQERAEQRQQLLAIQEELKRVRESRAAEKKEDGSSSEEVQE